MLYSIFAKIIILKRRRFGLSRFPRIMRLYRFLYQSLLLGKRVILIPVQEHKMYIDIGDMDIAPHLASAGIYQKQLTKVFNSTITKGMVCIDIGAMIGYFTLITAKLAGEEGKVFAFEPEPHNYDLLLKNIDINRYRNITPMQKAISNKNGSTKLFLNRFSLGGHSLLTPMQNDMGWQDSIEVEMQTLDTYLSDYNGKIDFVKIDVEGAELAVLEGMDNTIKKNKDLIIITEFFPKRLIMFGSSPEEYLNRFSEYGFTLYNIDEEKESVYPISVASLLEKCADGGSTNILVKR